MNQPGMAASPARRGQLNNREKLNAMAKNGSSRYFFGQKRVYLKIIAAGSFEFFVVGHI